MAAISVTEDEAGTQETMGRAVPWVGDNVPNSTLGAPEIITGQTLITATR